MSGVPRTEAGRAFIDDMMRLRRVVVPPIYLGPSVAAIEEEAVQDFLRSPEAEQALAEELAAAMTGTVLLSQLAKTVLRNLATRLRA